MQFLHARMIPLEFVHLSVVACGLYYAKYTAPERARFTRPLLLITHTQQTIETHLSCVHNIACRGQPRPWLVLRIAYSCAPYTLVFRILLYSSVSFEKASGRCPRVLLSLSRALSSPPRQLWRLDLLSVTLILILKYRKRR